MTPRLFSGSSKRARIALGLAVSVIVPMAGMGASSAVAESAKPAWQITSLAQPTNFTPTNPAKCLAKGLSNSEQYCDSYVLVVKNVGGAVTSGPIEILDTLPADVTHAGIFREEVNTTGGLECEPSTPLKCTTSEAVVPGGSLVVRIYVKAEPEPILEGSALTNKASVEGGGAEPASTSSQNTVSEQLPPFGIANFGLEVDNAEGVTDTQVGEHPYAVTANIAFPTVINGTGFQYVPVEHEKDIVVDLPPGFMGDPQATPRCPESSLIGGTGGEGIVGETGCPPDSQVGTVVVEDYFSTLFNVDSIRSYYESGVFPVYNIVPEKGDPAEFGFNYKGQSITMYVSVNPLTHYGVRVTVPGVIRGVGVVGASLTFWGTPADQSHTPQRQKQNTREEAGAVSTDTPEAFLTNPTACSTTPLKATVSVDSWENPGVYVSRETTVYPQLTGCDMLQFQPMIAVAPDTTQADEPSGYGVTLSVPQATNLFPDLAAPQLKDATVTLPEGVSLSPSAADGLVGCDEAGPEGINLNAEELGEGHPGGNGSPYDDGQLHAEHGHCPAGSTLGTVELTTPLLEKPLTGNVYLAQPKCGGAGQPACTEASATNGELYGLYLELEGSGVIVKLKGEASANPATGQLQATFKDNPQLPFSELKLHFNGGPRAPLANPQTCGSFTTTSDLTPWSTPVTPDATPSSSFPVDWDGAGGACPGSLPFAPSFTAGTVTPSAGAFSPFTLTFSRHDREQDLAQITVDTPPGLLGKIAGIPQCPEAGANAGTCSPASQIGTASVAAGPGSHAFWVSGPVYLTGPYKGAPFGLSVVVPAKAGPFNLGNEIVRSAIHIDPHTSALTIVSDPLPQKLDGIPFRLQTVNVTIDRPGFMFNPTNCSAQSITGTIAAAQGASASVSSPFAVAGCANLPFKLAFSASTRAKTSKALGASLTVKIAYPAEGEANLQKVDVELPKALPTQLKTLNKACTEAQFNSNPAGCPPHSDIAQVTVHTPVLASPLTGPAYLVSHGGAAFPDVEMVLQGEGVELIVDGKTQIKKGITYSHFETIPDAPISSFEFISPQGEYALFAANGDLCDQKLVMPTVMTGQNGAVISQDTPVEVEGCPNSISVLSHSVNKRTLTLYVYAPAAGKLTASGKGVSSGSKTYSAREALTFTLKQKKAGKLATKIKLTFTPRKGKKQTKTVKARFKH